MSLAPSRFPWPLAATLLVLALGMAWVGIWMYRGQQSWLVDVARRATVSGVQTRAREIEGWRNERLTEARAIQSNRQFLELTRQLLSAAPPVEAQVVWDEFAGIVLSHKGYSGAVLVDGEGRARHTTGARTTIDRLPGFLPPTAGRSGHAELIDPQVTGDGLTRMILAIPLLTAGGSAGDRPALLAIEVDPTQELQAILRGRAMPGSGTETLLVRRQGDGIAVLAGAAAPGSSPAGRVFPTSSGPAVARIVRGEEGPFDGPNLRGEPALVVARRVGDTNWWILSTVVTSSIVGQSRTEVGRIAMVVLLLVSTVGAMMLLVWQRRQAGFYRELYRAESRRQVLAESFEHLTRFANDVVLLADDRGRIVEANERALEVYGYSQTEFIGLSLAALRAPGVRDMTDRDLGDIAAQGNASYLSEHARKSGETFPVEVRARVFTIEGRGYFHGIIQDITERVAMDRQVRETAERYRELFESANDAIALADVESGTILDVNRRMAELMGRTVEELRGAHHTTLHPPEDDDVSRRNLRAQSEGQIAPVLQVYLQHRDGHRIPVEVSASPLRLQGRPVMLGIFRDLTERVEAEEALRSSETRRQKLESLALLAGGIAHDFNNLLVGISGNVSLAKQGVPPDTEAYTCLAEAERAGLRAEDLTRQLLTFSKGGAPIKKVVDLGHVLRETATFACRGTGVRCDVRLPAEPIAAEIDEGQIAQVINNIAINAVQAMPAGGVLAAGGDLVTLGPDDPRGLPPGLYARVTLADTGAGIEPSLLDRIFDPYFTTKRTGTGLGLAISHSIARRHGGDITVRSRVGVGSTFELLLPASSADVTAAASEPAAALPRGGRVLVMDDEAQVRELAVRMAAHLGFDGLAVGDGAEAVRVYTEAQREGRPFDIVIMDLTISGGLGGKETIAALLSVDPAARVIVSSGYSNDPIMANHRDYGFAAVLAKPYRLQDMRATLADVLRPTHGR